MAQSNSFSDSYAAAGVDITAGYKAVELMKQHVERTKIDGVVGDIGGFGGMFEPDINYETWPVLVSGTDGVGTKLKLAMLMDKHDTIGIDCVAMCVNDIVCTGAKPLFFLDYIACGKNYPEKIEQIVKGVADGCVQAGCALIGGETAEHPGMMADEDYDLAGFAVGLADRENILRPKETQKAGDVLIALPSSGVHSNGFSLIRKIFEIDEYPGHLNDYYNELDAQLGTALLEPTRIYVKHILKLMARIDVKAVTHITGGGFYENIPRNLPSGLSAHIKRSNVRVLPIFNIIARQGDISEREMFNVFNMGVGMVVTVAPDDVCMALELVEGAYVLGELVPNQSEVIID